MKSLSPPQIPFDQTSKQFKQDGLITMAGGAVHAVNNLLTTILGYASLARQETTMTPRLQEYLEEILAATNRAAALFRQLQAFTSRIHLQQESLDLNELFTQHLPTLELLIPETVQFSFAPRVGLPPIVADPRQLLDSLEHLVRNAVESLQNKTGTITLSTSVRDCDASFWETVDFADQCKPGQYVVIEVVDSGVGMSENILARAFDPFFSTKLVGRGLGLSHVLGISHSFGGVTGLESSEGQGAVVRMYLPVAPVESDDQV